MVRGLLEAFKNFKENLSFPHVLNSTLAREELFIYLAASEQAVSTMLVRQEAGAQKPIVYVRKVLKGAENRYMNIGKLAFALLLIVRKFKMHLEDHQGDSNDGSALEKDLI